MADWILDVRYCLRGLRRKPAFTGTVLATLALCIGLNTCIFNILHTILLQELPFRDPDRLVSVWTLLPDKMAATVGRKRGVSSYPNFEDWRAQNQVFDGMTALSLFQPVTVSGRGEPEQVDMTRVCEDFFPVLGVRPVLGRTFSKEEHAEGKDRVVILSHRYWSSRLQSDSRVLGQTILLDQSPCTIVGVLPEPFRFGLTFGRILDGEPDLWRPLFRGPHDNSRGNNSLYPIARLKPGVSFEQAQTEMKLIAERLALQYPETNEGYGVDLTNLHETLRGRHRSLLMLLMAAAGIVLLIGCANVANLLLSRAITREKEFALRASLGASRLRLSRLLITEGLLYGLLGGTVGLLLAAWGGMIANPLLENFVKGLPDSRLNISILLFNFAVSFLTAMTFSLAPLLQSSKMDLNRRLKLGATSAQRNPTRGILASSSVVGQVALALLLLVGAGLVARSFAYLLSLDRGFPTERLVVVEVNLTGESYRLMEQRQLFYESLLEAIGSLPGAEQAALTSHPPLARRGGNWAFRLEPTGLTLRELSHSEIPHADYQLVSADYFRTAGIPLKKGRFLTTADTRNSPAAIVINETMARKYWRDDDPIGQKIYLGGRADRSLTVVGIVGDVRQRGLLEETVPHMYWSYLQNQYGRYYLLVRTKAKPEALLKSMREQVKMLDASQFARISLLEEDVRGSLESPRLISSLFGLFSLLALALSLLGLYGMLSYIVSQSAGEIGIRMALGATPLRVLVTLLKYGIRRLFAGLCLGLVMAAALSRLLSSQLYGIRPTDFWTFAMVSALLVLSGLMACCLPAVRATRIDPIRSLRAE
jgi:putative ABC transport system permease protein